MKKDTLLEIILGTIGGLVFAIGMCMTLIPEWDLFNLGVVITVIGFILLLCIIPVYRSTHPKKTTCADQLGNCIYLDNRCCWCLNYGLWYK